jgi:NAD(P)-dependent dehydrogenase (short-subunit alcohol dehydrogenase family)
MGILDSYSLEGKVALVSGASGSLGTAVSKGLAEAGARVLLAGRSEARLEPVAKAVASIGGQAEIEASPSQDEASVRRIVEAAVERFGGLDILVTAAGSNLAKPIVEQSLEEWQVVVNSHLELSWLYCREAGRVMIERAKGGKVVLVGSQRGQLGMANYSAYSPAMAGIHLLTKSLACEWGPHGINVNCLAPGLFRSALTEWMWEDEATYKRMLARVPWGRLGEPEDSVGAVVFLCSAASDWMTGAILNVDGGYTAG